MIKTQLQNMRHFLLGTKAPIGPWSPRPYLASKQETCPSRSQIRCRNTPRLAEHGLPSLDLARAWPSRASDLVS